MNLQTFCDSSNYNHLNCTFYLSTTFYSVIVPNSPLPNIPEVRYVIYTAISLKCSIYTSLTALVLQVNNYPSNALAQLCTSNTTKLQLVIL